ncbi:MAG: hypothetical protein LBL94_04960 [Prevotellaceae bacterium]|jgi:hypothetical protein|nr:hypothetical protein [Prevotellaceae bacterium]
MKKKPAKNPEILQKFVEIDRLIASTSNLSIYEKQDLAERNIFSLLANIKIVI